MARNADGALVLFSGGQDSATCLAWALSRFDRVETVGFDYGQRHRVELDVRNDFRAEVIHRFPDWAERLGDDHRLDAGVIGIGNQQRAEIQRAAGDAVNDGHDHGGNWFVDLQMRRQRPVCMQVCLAHSVPNDKRRAI